MRIPRWIDFIWLALLLAYTLAGTPLVPLHGDEATQIYMGRDFYYQFVEGRPDLVAWSDDPDSVLESGATQQQLRLLNGTLPKYLFGLAAWLGGYSIGEINDQWVWGAGWDYNQQNGHIPTDDLLARTRWASAVLLAGAVIVSFVLGESNGGRGTAYLLSAYVAFSPALLLNGRRAMMEGALTFFSLLTVLAGLWLLRARLNAQRRWLLLLLLALSSGLTIASKHTGAFTVAAVFAALLIDSLLRRRKLLQQLGALVLAGIGALLVFLALNPAWWDDPLARARTVLNLRTELLSGQAATFDGYDNLPDQLAGFFRQSLIAQPMYAETDFDNFPARIAPQVATYEASGLAGIAIGGSTIGALLLSAAALWGLIRLLRGKVRPGSRLVIGVWAAAMFALTLLFTPLEWQRYYLPVLPVIGLLAALGIDEIARSGLQRFLSQHDKQT